MLLVIAQLLDAAVLEAVRAELDGGAFEDGARTAGTRAAKVKRNLQLRKTEANRERLNGAIIDALQASEVFRAATVPKRIHRPLFSRYEPGMEYGYHVDAALMDPPHALRTDIAVTIFLAGPVEYEGGELVIDSSLGRQMIKLDAGSAILYPASTLHRVAPVTGGIRLAAVTWVESHVRDPAAREVLFDIHRIARGLDALAERTLEADLAHKTYSNLLRMWAET